ncbi:hypothetical protein B0H10DRAFT_1831888, partial [Mycena sp. CBHHK59/15]
FPEGRGFKQWTRDDSKALMKASQVYLPTIEGHVPAQMLCAFSTFLDFCYLVCQNVVKQHSLPSMLHLLNITKSDRSLLNLFGAPNGLCSSITESKHITAVKEPWQRSSRYEAHHQENPPLSFPRKISEIVDNLG